MGLGIFTALIEAHSSPIFSLKMHIGRLYYFCHFGLKRLRIKPMLISDSLHALVFNGSVYVKTTMRHSVMFS